VGKSLTRNYAGERRKFSLRDGKNSKERKKVVHLTEVYFFSGWVESRTTASTRPRGANSSYSERER